MNNEVLDVIVFSIGWLLAGSACFVVGYMWGRKP